MNAQSQSLQQNEAAEVVPASIATGVWTSLLALLARALCGLHVLAPLPLAIWLTYGWVGLLLYWRCQDGCGSERHGLDRYSFAGRGRSSAAETESK